VVLPPCCLIQTPRPHTPPSPPPSTTHTYTGRLGARSYPLPAGTVGERGVTRRSSSPAAFVIEDERSTLLPFKMVGSSSSSSKSKLYLTVGGLAALGYFMHVRGRGTISYGRPPNPPSLPLLLLRSIPSLSLVCMITLSCTSSFHPSVMSGIITHAHPPFLPPSLPQWIYTRTEKRTLRHEARSAALLEQMSVRDYVASYLEDPATKGQFMKQVGREGGREGGKAGGWRVGGVFRLYTCHPCSSEGGKLLRVSWRAFSALALPNHSSLFSKNEKQVNLVRQSWNRLKPNRLELTAHVMYQRLRQEDPSTQEVYVSPFMSFLLC